MKPRFSHISFTILVLICMLLFCSCNSNSTSPFKRIKKVVDEIWLVDTHEHFPTEAGRNTTDIDFFSLIIGYMQADMISSGMSNEELTMMLDNSTSLDKRWEIFYPYWEMAKNTGYGQCVRLTAKGLFGIDEINENTYQIINDKMIAANEKEGWYKHVLKDKSRIDVSIIDPLGSNTHPDTIYPADFFVRVKRFDSFVLLNNINNIEKQYEERINSLSDYMNALDREFRKAVSDEGIVGIKSGLAYGRKLNYENVSSDEAKKLFLNFLQSPRSLDSGEKKKLEDFMMHQVADHAGKYRLPFQIHTGMLSRNYRPNPIENTNAVHLSNLFLKHRNTKFVIFHGSYPYMAELSLLAKHYPNVYIDMCWMYIISPSASRRYLEEWLFTVPSNKILAFGGDCSIEWAYGHAEMARNIVAEVLTKMVGDGYYSVDEAIEIATRILRTNALELFNIKNIEGNWKRGLTKISAISLLSGK